MEDPVFESEAGSVYEKMGEKMWQTEAVLKQMTHRNEHKLYLH
jgi:hypothetical protein